LISKVYIPSAEYLTSPNGQKRSSQKGKEEGFPKDETEGWEKQAKGLKYHRCLFQGQM
jgi:hypothetical protein